MIYVGCDGIVLQEGQVLMQQREDFRIWGQPGGGLEAGEYLLEGVQREVLEETGVEVEPERLLALHWRRWLGRDIMVFSFLCRPVGGELQTGPETVDVGYYPVEALPGPMRDIQRERLQQILGNTDRFQYQVLNSSQRSQVVHGLMLIGRAVRNKILRRPPWHPQPFTVGAFATIWDQAGRVLLLHRRDMEAWNLPGGGVEACEPPWEACIREVREESGLEVRVDRMTGVYAKPHKNEIVLNFDCTIVDGRLQSSEEADQAGYFALHELPDTLLTRQRERILDAAAGARQGDRWPRVKEQGADWQPGIHEEIDL